jgi:hypothetical protein
MSDRFDRFALRGGAAAAVRVLLIVALLGALAAISTYCTGCGSAHAGLALALRDGTNTAKQSYRDVRSAHLTEAGEAARTAGGDSAAIGAAIDAAAVAWDAEHEDVVSAHAVLAEASTAYTASALAAVTGRGSGEAQEQAARAAARAWNELVRVLQRHGFDDVPEIPEEVAGFLAQILAGLSGGAE